MRKFICGFLALVMLACTFPIMTMSTSAASPVISFSSPAIGADTGAKVTLSSYAVEFKDDTATAADKITWSSTDITVTNGTVTPDKTGVFKLTATAGSNTKTIYLVVKAPTDTEYVLFYDDFSDPTLEGYHTAQLTNGASYAVTDGKLVLDASHSGDGYVRLLLPSWLGEFGNYSITTSAPVLSSTATSRWFSIAARVQNSNYPYWHAAIRQNASTSNGMELAERNAGNAWNVTHKGAFTENISADKYYTITYNLSGCSATTYINGKQQLHSDTMTYATGEVGLFLRGMVASFDYIKITLT